MTAAATEFTYDFIRSALPDGARRVLEVGCGEGELAELLQRDGLAVTALDTDEECIAASKARGVNARRASWPDFQTGSFDAILFTRSLHHMHDLDTSVGAAFASLAPSGRLIVEDFDVAFDHGPSLAWLRDYCLALVASGLTPEEHSFVAQITAPSSNPAQAWHGSHDDHHLHSADAIEAALRGSGAQVDARKAAYFFRYVGAAFPGAPEVAQTALHDESQRIAAGGIEPLGRRFIAAI